jgi:signal transduction histidine kinase
MKLSLVAVDLPRFLHSLVDEVRLGDRDAHLFHFEPAGDAEPFTTDSHLLHHIVANLLTNAARYSPPGTVITTRLHCDALRAVLSVEDQGIGIPEADRPRLFQPFERGSNVGNIKGTGLGLSIVKRLVDLLGGTITFESAPGCGTRFTLEIPRPPTTPT